MVKNNMNSSTNKSAYNMAAKNYERDHKELVWKDELDKFIKYLDGPKIVVDLGSGHGDETIYLASKLKNVKVVGVDFAGEMIKLAVSKRSNVEFILEDMTEYMPNTNIDGIWARASFHHLSDQELDEVFRNIIGYSGRKAVLGMVNKYGEGEVLDEKEKYGVMLKRYFNFFNEKKVERLCEKYGFNVIEQYVKEDGGDKFLVSFLVSK